MAENRKKRNIIAVVLEILLVTAALSGAAYHMARQAERSLYEERKQSLSLLARAAAQIVDENVAGKENLEKAMASCLKEDLLRYGSVEECLKEEKDRYGLEDGFLFVADDMGKFYCSDGQYGKMDDLSAYESGKKRFSYIGTLPHLDQSKAYMIFAERLNEPLSINDGSSQIICFFYACNMDGLCQKIDNVLEDDMNIYIYRNDGTMLHQEYGFGQLSEGYNIYPKLSMWGKPFKEDPEALEAQIKDRKNAVVELNIDEEDCYFCSAPLDIADLSLGLLIRKESMDALSKNPLSRYVLYVYGILAALGLSLLASILGKKKEKSIEETKKEEAIAQEEPDVDLKEAEDSDAKMTEDIVEPESEEAESLEEAVSEEEVQEDDEKIEEEGNIGDKLILLVDEDEETRNDLARLLEENGALVDMAADGIEAIEKFHGSQPFDYDAILMAASMRRMDGLDASRAIRSFDREDADKILIVGMIEEDGYDMALKAGMNGCIRKPIDIKEAIRSLSCACNKEES